MRLSAQLAGSAHFTCYPCHFGGKAIELIHHGVNGAFQLENFAFYIHGDFFRQVTLGDCGGDLGNIAHLSGQVRRHRIYVVSQTLPCPGHTGHLRLSTQPAVGADFARYPCHFRGKAVELIHHGINGAFQFENFAFHIHGNFFRQITFGHRSGDLGDIAHLSSEIRRHRIHVVS